MNRLKNNLEKIVKYNLLILVFIPLIVAFDFLYPYILPRSLFFRIIIEILFIITVILLFQNKLNKLPKSLLVYTSLLFILILPLVSIFSIDVNESFFGNLKEWKEVFIIFIYLFILYYY